MSQISPRFSHLTLTYVWTNPKFTRYAMKEGIEDFDI